MAGSPRPVRDLYDVEDLLLLRPSKRSRGKVEIPRCRLEEEAAINAAIKLKSMVDSGDVSLVNPDVLASKLRAKDAIEEAIKEMVEKQMEWSSRETQEVDACIAILKNRLQTPDADIPLPGPSMAPQGKRKVIDHCIYPESKQHRRKKREPLRCSLNGHSGL
ncbi:hypothetical protein VPH35_099440 [Triticum aestivum]|uniref:uncharacterized protein n=1 Tax=Triticum aestivum TaxID=4565 RepID=UPI001D02CA17|nr:uncharacterized protein LOC123125395 [Triticum aestivum]